MDVRIMANPAVPASKAGAESFLMRPEAESPHVQDKQKNHIKEVQDDVLMDLKEVQRFLYMMIGSTIRVESENNAMGGKLNTIV